MSLQEVAGACEGFSGADLSALLADAQLEAVHEVLARPGGADEVRRCAPVMPWVCFWWLCSSRKHFCPYCIEVWRLQCLCLPGFVSDSCVSPHPGVCLLHTCSHRLPWTVLVSLQSK